MFRIPTANQRLRDLIAQQDDVIRVQSEVLESERQWRLKSLPALLDADRRRVAAEIERDQYAQRVAELTAEVVVLTDRMRAPWVALPRPTPPADPCDAGRCPTCDADTADFRAKD